MLEQRAREQAKMQELGLTTPAMAATKQQDDKDESME